MESNKEPSSPDVSDNSGDRVSVKSAEAEFSRVNEELRTSALLASSSSVHSKHTTNHSDIGNSQTHNHSSTSSNSHIKQQDPSHNNKINHDIQNEKVAVTSNSTAAATEHKANNDNDNDDNEDNEPPFDLEATLRSDRSAATSAGIKPKRIGVLWRDLTVRGAGGGGKRLTCKTFFPDAFIDFFDVVTPVVSLVRRSLTSREQRDRRARAAQVDVLTGFRGLVRHGEMCLVLGRPGAGCTSFMRVVSNQRAGYTSFEGDVRYGSFGSEEFGRRFRGEAVYNAENEDTAMLPTLTVGQTLEFALETKMSSHRPAGLSRSEFKDKIVTMLLRMFNIKHTKDTFVGGPFVRGISGGERKRVAIAEMMITNACVLAFDNPTKGLDASTAVDYIRSMRVLSDINQTTTFVTAYQVSESIYREFDKVMVIDGGRLAYFGPATKARGYFEDLGFEPKPRLTSADFLTACTDPFEREYKDGVVGPKNAEELAEEFNNSKWSKLLDEEMDEYEKSLEKDAQNTEDFHQAIQQSKHHTSSRDVYSIPLYLQIWVLTKRQFILKKQDTFSLAVNWITILMVALLLSTSWVNQPLTSAGAFSRGGVMFISLLFNGFQAFGEIGVVLMGRSVVAKHRAYTFYRPSALWFAQVFVDLCFQSLPILAFCIMVYFSVNLVSEAGAFFTFVITILVGYICLSLYFRTMGIISKNLDVALRLGALSIIFMVLTSGYPIQYDTQKVWIRWLFWLNPAGLGFSALMINEFKRIDLTCVDSQLVPFGPGYNDIDHQSCTLLGSTPGNLEVSGTDYLRAQFGYLLKDQWRNFGIILALVAFFLCLTILLGEILDWGGSGRTVTFYTKETKKNKELNRRLEDLKLSSRNADLKDNFSTIKVESKAVLTWEELSYDVTIPGGKKRILTDIFGYVKPGQLTALMGASGAGKTTLLDVLAARKNTGVISGEILVDGVKPGAAFQRGTAYAEQLDVHEPAMSVREALQFSANLRQPYEIPQSEKYLYVEEVISLLELEDVADAIIGSADFGLAPYHRKLLTIGVELAAKPQLLLFLDEPTSGLDSQSAWNIARFLRKLTAAGQAILCTIHQPNSALFTQFDRLLLLQKGGQCVYFGEIGENSSTLIEYFRRNNAICPPDANPAEWMLDAIGAGLTRRLGSTEWGKFWLQSPELEKVKEEISELHTVVSRVKSAQHEKKQKEYATPLWHQIKHVVARQSISFFRTPEYGFTRLFNHVGIALIAGLIFINQDNSRNSLQNTIFLVFQFTILPAIILAQVQPKYQIARSIAYREEASKAYKTLPFVLSMTIAELPYSIICAVGFFLPIYYMPGLNPDPSRAGYMFLLTLAMELFAVTLGQLLGAITPTPKIAALLNAPIIITFALFSGVALPYPQMPAFWRAWLFELDPFGRFIAGAIVTELHQRVVQCVPNELVAFTAPEGVASCGEYMADWFAAGGAGYLANNDTTNCEYCAFSVGDEFYTPLSYRFEHRWRDLGIFIAFIGSNLIITMTAARYLNYNKR